MTPHHTRYPAGPLLRCVQDLDVEEVATEEVLHVATARVVLAEYEIIQHDFPELNVESLCALNPHLQLLEPAKREDEVRSIIDEWLIANAAFTSRAQAVHALVNTPIETDGRVAIAYRPPKYGRAVVLPTRSPGRAVITRGVHCPPSQGLLDVKGAGVGPLKIPNHGIQSSGLEYLGMALSDYLIQKAIDEIFARAARTLWTIPVYAILDLGFDIRDWYLGTGPAGVHVRRAHRRPKPGGNRSIEEKVSFEIECLLRRYGITTATRGRQLHISKVDGQLTLRKHTNTPRRVITPTLIGLCNSLLGESDKLTVDRRDVQLTRELSWPPARAQMVDFGHLRIEARFDCPMTRGLSEPGLDDVLWQDDPDFIQPDPALCLPVETWQRYDLALRCLKWASEFRNNEISRDELRHRIEEPIMALVDKWSHARADVPQKI